MCFPSGAWGRPASYDQFSCHLNDHTEVSRTFDAGQLRNPMQEPRITCGAHEQPYSDRGHSFRQFQDLLFQQRLLQTTSTRFPLCCGKESVAGTEQRGAEVKEEGGSPEEECVLHRQTDVFEHVSLAVYQGSMAGWRPSLKIFAFECSQTAERNRPTFHGNGWNVH